MKKIILSGLMLISGIYTFASTNIYALHINGMLTTRDDAYKNLRELNYAAMTASNLVKWDLLYNNTAQGSSFFEQLYDVYQQKAHSNEFMSLDNYTSYYISQFPDKYPIDLYYPGSAAFEVLKGNMAPLYQDQLINAGGMNLKPIIDQFHNIVKPLKPNNYSSNKDFVLLIPHSQGNLYSNYLYTELIQNEGFDPNHIAIYGIASPAAVNKGNWLTLALQQLQQQYSQFNVWGYLSDYLTSTKDIVIAFANVLTTLNGDPVLPSNFTIPFFHLRLLRP